TGPHRTDVAQPRAGRRQPLPAPPDRPEQPVRRDPGRLPAAPARRLRGASGAPGTDRRLLHRTLRATGRPGRPRTAGRAQRPLLLRLLAAGAAPRRTALLADGEGDRQPRLLPGAAAQAAGLRGTRPGRSRLAQRAVRE